MVKCKAKTQKGTQCSREATKDGFCAQHAKSLAKESLKANEIAKVAPVKGKTKALAKPKVPKSKVVKAPKSKVVKAPKSKVVKAPKSKVVKVPKSKEFIPDHFEGMENLPCDVILKIASNLSDKEYVRLARTSKTLHNCLDKGRKDAPIKSGKSKTKRKAKVSGIIQKKKEVSMRKTEMYQKILDAVKQVREFGKTSGLDSHNIAGIKFFPVEDQEGEEFRGHPLKFPRSENMKFDEKVPMGKDYRIRLFADKDDIMDDLILYLDRILYREKIHYKIIVTSNEYFHMYNIFAGLTETELEKNIQKHFASYGMFLRQDPKRESYVEESHNFILLPRIGFLNRPDVIYDRVTF